MSQTAIVFTFGDTEFLVRIHGYLVPVKDVQVDTRPAHEPATWYPHRNFEVRRENG